MHIKINKKYLIYNKYKVKCALGKRGIGNKKKEGDLITPKGHFKIKYVLYRKDRIENIKTTFKKIVIRKNMGWCDDPRSEDYNRLIKYPFFGSSEKLFRKDNLYDVILVLNFNMRPVIKNKGSAIFIHIASKKFTATKGCIAIKKNEILKLIKLIDRNVKIRIY